MSSIRTLLVLACLVLAGILASAYINYPKIRKSRPEHSNSGFAVVELFTSEGCSSCPPADGLVARIQKESMDKPIYILAYHVDYWNRLGWKDVFSSPEYSARQNQYAQWLNLSTVYTPQIVVNGKTEFVGSEEGNLRNAIRNGLQKNPIADLSLTANQVKRDRLSIKYDLKGDFHNAALVLALIEKSAIIKVQRGENEGRSLSHVQIVRQLKNIPLGNNFSGSENMVLPHGYNLQDNEVIGLIQNLSNGEIIGASKSRIFSEMNSNL